MDDRARSALGRLARAFDAAEVPFQLGGSGLLHAHGLVDRVGDLDLVSPGDARPAVGAVLTALSGRVPTFDAEQEPGFVSDWRSRHELDGQPLDLSGGVAVTIEGRKVRLPFRRGATWDLDGRPIPLAPPEQWLLIYLVHGSDRAGLLAAMVDRAAWAALHRELDLPGRWESAVFE